MKPSMLAAVFTAPGRLELAEVPVPEARKEDEVLLKVEAAGICGTDLQILKVPPGHPAKKRVVLGHEYLGEVVAAGPAAVHLRPGDRVVVDPNITCGLCSPCRNGRPNLCAGISTLGIFRDGGFARYNVAPARALYKISPRVPAETAVLAEPLSCVLNAARKTAMQPGETAVVLGAGPIGVCFSLLFSATGAGAVILTDTSPARREHARRIGAAAAVVDPLAEDLPGMINEQYGEAGADVVVDTTGKLLAEALLLCRPGGRVILFGQDETAVATVNQNLVTRREIEVTGSFIAHYTFPAAVRVLERGLLPLEKMITHRFPLRDIEEGIAVMREGQALKVIIDTGAD